MKKFQMSFYVLGIIVAVVIVAGLGAKAGGSDSIGARAEMCAVGPASFDCSSNGAIFNGVAVACVQRYDGSSEYQYLTHMSYERSFPWVCTGSVQAGGGTVFPCAFELTYNFIDNDCQTTCR